MSYGTATMELVGCFGSAMVHEVDRTSRDSIAKQAQALCVKLDATSDI